MELSHAEVFRNDGRWYFRFRVHETPVYRSHGETGLPEQIKDTSEIEREI